MAQSTERGRLRRRVRIAVAFVATLAALASFAKTQSVAAAGPSSNSLGTAERNKIDGAQDSSAAHPISAADADFVATMRIHDQTAVDMARAEVQDGKDPELVRMANDIIASEGREIAAFDRWLDARRSAAIQATPE